MSRVFAVFVALCVSVVLMQHVDAGCYGGDIIESFCVHDGVRYEPGEKWKDNMNKYSSNECNCSALGWMCCTYVTVYLLENYILLCI